MRIYQVEYDSILNLRQLPIEKINSAKSIWIHLTTTLQSRRNLEKILEEVEMVFPFSHITGIRTEGSVKNSQYDRQGTFITVVTFDETKTALYSIEKPDLESCKRWIEGVFADRNRPNEGLALLFVDPLHVDAEEVMKLFHRIDDKFFPLAQLASDGERDYDSYVIAGKRVLRGGISLLLLGGATFQHRFTYLEDLNRFGLPFEITKAEGRRLYDIDGLHAETFLSKNLGDEYMREFPLSGWRVTIAPVYKGRCLARTPLRVSEDRSIQYVSSIEEGSHGYFVYTDEEKPYFFNYPTLSHDRITPAYFYFYDVVHRHYRRAKMARELDILAQSGKVFGACGFGIVTLIDDEIVAFNQSTFILMMAETERKDSIITQTQALRIAIPRRHMEILETVMDHYIRQKMSEIEILPLIGALWLSDNDAAFIYDRNLHLITISPKAERQWAIRARIDYSDDLSRLDTWIVQSLRKGLDGHLLITHGTLIDPLSGQPLDVRLDITPLKNEEKVIGGIVKIERDEQHFDTPSSTHL